MTGFEDESQENYVNAHSGWIGASLHDFAEDVRRKRVKGRIEFHPNSLDEAYYLHPNESYLKRLNRLAAGIAKELRAESQGSSNEPQSLQDGPIWKSRSEYAHPAGNHP
ncbi:MAG: hypothetical protein ACK5QT_11775 [Oligoflexia bacterium]